MNVVERADQTIREWIGECNCDDGFSSRDLADPQCHWCQAGEGLARHLAEAGLLNPLLVTAVESDVPMYCGECGEWYGACDHTPAIRPLRRTARQETT